MRSAGNAALNTAGWCGQAWDQNHLRSYNKLRLRRGFNPSLTCPPTRQHEAVKKRRVKDSNLRHVAETCVRVQAGCDKPLCQLSIQNYTGVALGGYLRATHIRLYDLAASCNLPLPANVHTETYG